MDSQINSFLQSVPDGSTVEFQPGGCYGQDGTFLITDRNNLVIDGNGSTFKALTVGTSTRDNWRIQSGSDITLENMTIVGANPNAGTGSSCMTTNLQWQHGIDFQSTQGGVADHVTIEDVYGDFVEAMFDQRYNLPNVPPARNILVENSTFNANGRMGLGLTDVQGFTMQNSSMSNTCWSAVDLELDSDSEYGQNVNILNNKFDHIHFYVFANAGAGNGSNVGDVTVSGNTETNALSCDGFANVLPPSGYYRSGYTFNNNAFVTYGDAVDLTRTDNATVNNNGVTFENGGCTGHAGVAMTDAHTVSIQHDTFAYATAVDTVDSLTTGVSILDDSLL